MRNWSVQISWFGLDVCGSSLLHRMHEYGRIRMVETFCSRAIQNYLWRSLEIDIIFTFCSALFRLNNPFLQGHPTNLFLTLSVPQRNLAGWQKYRCSDELAGKFIIDRGFVWELLTFPSISSRAGCGNSED